MLAVTILLSRAGLGDTLCQSATVNASSDQMRRHADIIGLIGKLCDVINLSLNIGKLRCYFLQCINFLVAEKKEVKVQSYRRSASVGYKEVTAYV